MRVSSKQDNKNIVDITILTMPTKLRYQKDDIFRPDGLSVRITYENGSTEVVNSFEEILEPILLTDNEQSVTIFFYQNNQTFPITIPITMSEYVLDRPTLGLDDYTLIVQPVAGATGYKIYEDGVLIGKLHSDGTWEAV